MNWIYIYAIVTKDTFPPDKFKVTLSLSLPTVRLSRSGKYSDRSPSNDSKTGKAILVRFGRFKKKISPTIPKVGALISDNEVQFAAIRLPYILSNPTSERSVTSSLWMTTVAVTFPYHWSASA